LLRRKAGTLRLNGNLRLHEIGKDIELGIGENIYAIANQYAGERNDNSSEFQREMDKGAEH
jgi:hypothetical protein